MKRFALLSCLFLLSCSGFVLAACGNATNPWLDIDQCYPTPFDVGALAPGQPACFRILTGSFDVTNAGFKPLENNFCFDLFTSKSYQNNKIVITCDSSTVPVIVWKDGIQTETDETKPVAFLRVSGGVQQLEISGCYFKGNLDNVTETSTYNYPGDFSYRWLVDVENSGLNPGAIKIHDNKFSNIMVASRQDTAYPGRTHGIIHILNSHYVEINNNDFLNLGAQTSIAAISVMSSGGMPYSYDVNIHDNELYNLFGSMTRTRVIEVMKLGGTFANVKVKVGPNNVIHHFYSHDTPTGGMIAIDVGNYSTAGEASEIVGNTLYHIGQFVGGFSPGAVIHGIDAGIDNVISIQGNTLYDFRSKIEGLRGISAWQGTSVNGNIIHNFTSITDPLDGTNVEYRTLEGIVAFSDITGNQVYNLAAKSNVYGIIAYAGTGDEEISNNQVYNLVSRGFSVGFPKAETYSGFATGIDTTASSGASVNLNTVHDVYARERATGIFVHGGSGSATSIAENTIYKLAGRGTNIDPSLKFFSGATGLFVFDSHGISVADNKIYDFYDSASYGGETFDSPWQNGIAVGSSYSLVFNGNNVYNLTVSDSNDVAIAYLVAVSNNNNFTGELIGEKKGVSGAKPIKCTGPASPPCFALGVLLVDADVNKFNGVNISNIQNINAPLLAAGVSFGSPDDVIWTGNENVKKNVFSNSRIDAPTGLAVYAAQNTDNVLASTYSSNAPCDAINDLIVPAATDSFVTISWLADVFVKEQGTSNAISGASVDIKPASGNNGGLNFGTGTTNAAGLVPTRFQIPQCVVTRDPLLGGGPAGSADVYLNATNAQTVYFGGASIVNFGTSSNKHLFHGSKTPTYVDNTLDQLVGPNANYLSEAVLPDGNGQNPSPNGVSESSGPVIIYLSPVVTPTCLVNNGNPVSYDSSGIISASAICFPTDCPPGNDWTWRTNLEGYLIQQPNKPANTIVDLTPYPSMTPPLIGRDGTINATRTGGPSCIANVVYNSPPPLTKTCSVTAKGQSGTVNYQQSDLPFALEVSCFLDGSATSCGSLSWDVSQVSGSVIDPANSSTQLTIAYGTGTVFPNVVGFPACSVQLSEQTITPPPISGFGMELACPITVVGTNAELKVKVWNDANGTNVCPPGAAATSDYFGFEVLDFSCENNDPGVCTPSAAKATYVDVSHFCALGDALDEWNIVSITPPVADKDTGRIKNTIKLCYPYSADCGGASVTSGVSKECSITFEPTSQKAPDVNLLLVVLVGIAGAFAIRFKRK